MKLSVVFFSALMTLFSISANASGGGGFGGGGGGFSGGSTSQRAVDQTYEVGKAIYNGRQRGTPRLSYCVASDDGKVPVKRKSLKPFKNTTFTNLAQNLYNCDNPESLVSEELSRDSLIHVLYYLDKRHKLSLRGR